MLTLVLYLFSIVTLIREVQQKVLLESQRKKRLKKTQLFCLLKPNILRKTSNIGVARLKVWQPAKKSTKSKEKVQSKKKTTTKKIFQRR
jgi:hypothetical protein